MKYDFKCQNCDIIFEKEMSIKEYEENKDKITCPKCGSKTKRLYTYGTLKIKTGDGIK